MPYLGTLLVVGSKDGSNIGKGVPKVCNKTPGSGSFLSWVETSCPNGSQEISLTF